MVDQLRHHGDYAVRYHHSTQGDWSDLYSPESLSDVSLLHPQGPLFAEEYEIIASAVPRRQREFFLGRSLAHDVLAELGCSSAPLLRDDQGAPLWPAGIHGSLSHSQGLCLAIATAGGTSIGVDVERHQPLPPGVARTILTPQEETKLPHLSSHYSLPTVVFSAKEALYKAWYPLTHQWLGFHDAQTTLTVQRADHYGAQGTFTATLSDSVLPHSGDIRQRWGRAGGEWWIVEDYIVTVWTIPPLPDKNQIH